MSEAASPSEQPLVQPQAPASPAAAPTPAGAPARQESTGVSFLQAAVLAVVCSAAAGYFAFTAAVARQPNIPQIAFLDSARITSAQLDEMLNQPGVTPEQARAAGQKLVSDLNREMQRYTDAGIVVVNSSMVLNKAPGLDVTKDVASALGVKLK